MEPSAAAAAAVVGNKMNRPPALNIPVLNLVEEHEKDLWCTTPTRTTPVHRRLFAAAKVHSDAQQHSSAAGKLCMNQWLQAMEQSGSRRGSSSSSSLGSSPSSPSSRYASAHLLPAPAFAATHHLQDQDDEEGGCYPGTPLAADLPPPAFVVLGLLSRGR